MGQGTPISDAAKEAILLKLVNSRIVLTNTTLPIPQGYRMVVAWDELNDQGKHTKSFVLLESTRGGQ